MAIAVPYTFKNGSGASLSVSSTSANTTLTMGAVDQQIKVYNALSEVVFIRFGDSAPTATTSDNPIAPGAVEVISVPPGTTHIAGITASGSGTIYAIPVRGI